MAASLPIKRFYQPIGKENHYHEVLLLQTTRDLADLGIPRQYLRMAHERGLVQRVARGLYRVPGGMVSEHQSLAEVCKRVPSGVICLISALSFHELTTQIPHFVYLAIDDKARAPQIEHIKLRVFRFSGKALTEGVEKHNVGPVEVRVYCAAKTVVDCFKYRNKTGLDVAIEALRDCLRQRKAKVDDLVRYGRICRVEEIMRPYMEALLG
jgi:predicted transcriptional regulator of viral defense system